MSDFNYSDSFSSSKSKILYAEQNDKAIELQGRKTYIFKLAKEETVKSEIYNEAKDARIYLPHFEQRALYDTNTWTGNINTNNYNEQEDTLKFTYNFARMVCNIRNLKDKKSGYLTVKNTSKEILFLSTENKKFVLKSSKGVVLLDLNLEDFKSIQLLINTITSKSSLITASYSGDTESADNLCVVNMRLLPNRNEKIDVLDKTYENCTDVIETGDIILTDAFKLYQVNNCYPVDAFVNDYTSWCCHCNIIDVAMANLPMDYRKIVEQRRYNLPKNNIE